MRAILYVLMNAVLYIVKIFFFFFQEEKQELGLTRQEV